MDQKIFTTIYRGHQSAWHHLAYMRMGKVLLILRALDATQINLSAKSLFDYGFGAGTFFRYCPKTTQLAGVEQDPAVCREVAEMLSRRGFGRVDLQPITISQWQEHPLLQREYDVFLCSHVLEHLPAPADFLAAVRKCLKPDGIFLGLVPINERAINPHHLQTVDRATVRLWAEAAGYEVTYYEENDPFLYLAQPLYTATTGWKHKLAQVLSLGLGCCATLCGQRLWFAFGSIFAKLTSSKSTQAIFVLHPR